jgi:ribosomal protein L11 methyltransferase
MNTPAESTLPEVWRIALTTSTAKAALYAEALEELCPTVSWIDTDEDGVVEVEALAEFKPDRAEVERLLRAVVAEDLPPVTIEPLEHQDWLELSYQSFPPRTLGRFWIYGSHITDAPPAGLWPLMIDAATAFGSGEHPTTAGCLLAIEELHRLGPKTNILDMGTGSGILAVAAARVWENARITAIDIDPESIRVTRNHATANNVLHHMELAAGDGFNTELALAHQPYDLILANILAGPLTEMAPAGAAQLASGGHVVLAGLLETQAEMVLAAWQAQGLKLLNKWQRGEWTILMLQKEQAA